MINTVSALFPLGGGGGGGSGAMHFKDTISSASSLPASPAAGDVYMASADFTISGVGSVETGDMIVYNGTAWKIVQGNLDPTSFEAVSNKVTSLSSGSTDIQYPSAKCVYDAIGNVETLLASL